MNHELINKLEQIKEQTGCSKKYRCLEGFSENLISAKYKAQADLMECFDDQSNSCKFSIAFSNTFTCKCPLRKFFAINSDKL